MIESDFESPLPHKSNHNDKPPSVIERYFKKRYKTDNKYEDQLVLTHSNRVCVVCVADSHPLIEQKKSVTSVSFGEEGWNRLDNKFSGKSKRGAQWLDCKAPLCEVTCSDGTKYKLVCCVKGQLIEVNENLQKTPQLLVDKLANSWDQSDGVSVWMWFSNIALTIFLGKELLAIYKGGIPHGEGYLAVILPGLKWFEHEMKQLKSEEDYKNELEKRIHNS